MYINKKEITLFKLSLQAVANHLHQDNVNLDDFYKLNVFFTEDGKISFHENKDNVNGVQLYMVIYKMEKLRKYNNDSFMVFVFLEELVHYFWRIYNETDVKYKIVEIIQDVVPGFTIEIAKGWGLNGL